MWVTFFSDDLLSEICVTDPVHQPLIKAYPYLTDLPTEAGLTICRHQNILFGFRIAKTKHASSAMDALIRWTTIARDSFSRVAVLCIV